VQGNYLNQLLIKLEDIIMTQKQFTEKLYEQYRSPEEAAIALTAKLNFHCDAKQKLDDTLVHTCIQGGDAIEKFDKKMYRIDSLIEETANHLEELKAFIAVGYPACLTTNASSVEEEYKRKMVIYNAKQSGISISDDHVIMDEDDPLGVMNM
tara:strand:- start:76 stop:531 length:456 start_codon:yes stop_codon:yes gene_type:complete